jgi:hypothetical protein
MRHIKVFIGKYLYENFLVGNVLKQGDILSPLTFKVVLEYSIKKVQENQVETDIERDT